MGATSTSKLRAVYRHMRQHDAHRRQVDKPKGLREAEFTGRAHDAAPGQSHAGNLRDSTVQQSCHLLEDQVSLPPMLSVTSSSNGHWSSFAHRDLKQVSLLLPQTSSTSEPSSRCLGSPAQQHIYNKHTQRLWMGHRKAECAQGYMSDS